MLEDFRAETGALKDLSFGSISGSGPNGALPHYRVTKKSNRKIKPGEIYLIDSGGQYLDGTTDVTRTIIVGTPTAEMKDRFTRVLKGHIALARARFPEGTTGVQLDTLARLSLWEAGLDYDHGTGHGVGAYLSVHEGPQNISKRQINVPLTPRHDRLERTRLLQSRPLRHPHRKPDRRHRASKTSAATAK